MRHLAFTVKSVSFKSFDLHMPQGMRNCSTSVTAGHSWSQLEYIIFIPNTATGCGSSELRLDMEYGLLRHIVIFGAIIVLEDVDT